MWRWLKQLLIGRPLETAVLHEQRLSKKAGLVVFSSDNLSSVAYATEEILLALMIAGTAALTLSLPTAIIITVLLVILVFSYSQTLYAYPSGGGAYTVAKENLGVTAGLVAGAALLIDYVLTVSVSVAAGIAAITSAVPALYPYSVQLCVAAIVFVMLANLRGVRESATIFAVPVFLFIGSGLLLVFVGIGKSLSGGHPEPVSSAWTAGTAYLIVRAFASGCAALTGVEAVANGVQAFKPPVSRNASITLYTMAAILGALFLGVTLLSRWYQVVPREGETVLSQIARNVFGSGFMYFVMQIATMAILVLAANTSFAGFPRLSSVLAGDRFLPRQLANRGDRLVFSNGILFLGVVASLLVIAFQGKVHRLIPLYAIGVFLSFTLSQAGMVAHWWRHREAGWRRHMVLNAVGATATSVAVLDIAFVKFLHGAWVVVIAIPLLVYAFRRVRLHYFLLGTQLSLGDYEKPKPRRNTVVVPVADINKVVLAAIEYAHSISADVIALRVNLDHADRREFERRWQEWAGDTPLVVLNSPYRSILRPVLQFVEEISRLRPEDVITVILPEFVPARWWHELMHNQTGLLLRSALLFKPRVVVTSVRHHLAR